MCRSAARIDFCFVIFLSERKVNCVEWAEPYSKHPCLNQCWNRESRWDTRVPSCCPCQANFPRPAQDKPNSKLRQKEKTAEKEKKPTTKEKDWEWREKWVHSEWKTHTIKAKKRGEENRGTLLARIFGDGISTVLCSRRSGVITHDGPLIRLSPSSL